MQRSLWKTAGSVGHTLENWWADHGIIESQGWKGPTRSSSPTVLPLPLLPQAPKPYLVAPHPDTSVPVLLKLSLTKRSETG